MMPCNLTQETEPTVLPLTIHRPLSKEMGLDWSYVAGFLDGEGTVVVYRYKEKRSPFREYNQTRIDLVQKGPEVLRLIKEFLHKNGCITISLYHLRNRSFAKESDIYRLSITNKHDLQIVLSGVLPYLIVKRAKASALQSILESKKGRFDVNRKRYRRKDPSLLKVRLPD